MDDALLMSENGEKVLWQKIGKYFELKEALIGSLDMYLRGKVSQVQFENGVREYFFSSSQYMKNAVC